MAARGAATFITARCCAMDSDSGPISTSESVSTPAVSTAPALNIAGGAVRGMLGRESINPASRRVDVAWLQVGRSEEHTSELQSLMRISYAVFCLKKKNTDNKSNSKQK